MVLFSFSAIWGLGYIHIYPRFNSKGNDPYTYPHCPTISLLDLYGGGLLCTFWVWGRAIGKGIDFHDFGIRKGIDFHDFGIGNGIDFRNFRNWYRVGYAFSENWYKVRYIF